MSGGRRFCAVIPAAGLSSRMGGFKPLLPYGGRTVIEASVGSALAWCDTVVAVLGKRSDELRELLSRRFGSRVIFAENRDYADTDMLASVRLGVAALGECDAFFIAPADMPAILPATYAALIREFGADDEILLPVSGGKRGHPPLIAARLIPLILAFDGEDGLRGFYRGRTVREIPVFDDGAVTDLDTPADYERLLRREGS